MPFDWFKPRHYRHFDLPVNEAFAKKAMKPTFVSRHSFSPLIHYTKSEKKYKICAKSGVRTIVAKERPIKYASHRDACIYAWYADQINRSLSEFYDKMGIGDSVIAYRSLGKGNYDFTAEVLGFVKEHQPVMIMAFDVSSFFDTLNHQLIKQRIKVILNVDEIPDDWYKVFRNITCFHYIDRDDLRKNAVFGPRLSKGKGGVVATVKEIKESGIVFRPNPELDKGFRRGIPQGTPISAAISNLYMMDFDVAARALCDEFGALYRRYSDDILVVCEIGDAKIIEDKIKMLISQEKIDISPHKTEKTVFDASGSVSRTAKAAQYLGFSLDESGVAIRESSLSRQWRRMRRAMRRARKSAMWRLKNGLPATVHTKKLYRRFSYISVNDGKSIRALRNFSSYGRRSAVAFGPGEKISGQVKRFERAALRELAALKALKGKHKSHPELSP